MQPDDSERQMTRTEDDQVRVQSTEAPERKDMVQISDEGKAAAVQSGMEETNEAETTENGPSNQSKTPEKGSGSEDEYTADEQKQIQDLEARDREVRAHEQAHISAGGQYVNGGAHFEYQTGPNGEKYAVGGEVSIDVAKEPDDPQATIRKMQTVKRAALAPASPSAQDRSVAAKASRTEMEARAELTEMNQSESQGDSEEPEIKPRQQAPEGYTATMDTSNRPSSIDTYI